MPSRSGTLFALTVPGPSLVNTMAVRVLIVDTKSERSARLERALRASGFVVLAVVADTSDLNAQVRLLEPDAIIIDSDSPTRDTLEHLVALHRRYPRPMVMFTEQGDSKMTRAAAEAGVSAYVVESASPQQLRSLVEVAILHFQAHHLLQAELEKIRQTLEGRQWVDRAKCLLMEQRGLSEQEAYVHLRRLSMNRGQRISDLARAMLAGTVA